MSWLCCLSRVSLSLVSSCKSSDLNVRFCSCLSRKKPTTSKLHLLLYPQCHFHLAPYVLLSLQIFPVLSFSFAELSFFRFQCRLSFFGSTFTFFNLSIRSTRSCSFSESSSLLRPVPLTSRLVFDL